jgi:osmoprotectant transport system permease protein
MRWAPTHLDDIGQALLEHLLLVGVSVGIGFVISLGLGILAARNRTADAVITLVTGAFFIVPSLALFALLIPVLGLGTKPAIVSLVLYCLLIMVRNVATGLRLIPAEIIDAARGMGYGTWRQLIEIELPLALPHVVAGIRLATVTVIGIATVAAYINAGGLGTIIFAGIDQRYPEKIFVGGGLTSALAIGANALLGIVERRLRRDRGMPA